MLSVLELAPRPFPHPLPHFLLPPLLYLLHLNLRSQTRIWQLQSRLDRNLPLCITPNRQ
jgi:hypothetical protein